MTRTLRRVWSRLLGSLSGRHRDADLAAELESHVQLLADEYIRGGVPADEARRRARVRFGSLESTKERYRDQRGLPLLDTLVRDVRYAWRGIRRSPGFSLVAILSVAIGIGANTAIFSVIDSVLLRSLPYADPDRVFMVNEVTTDARGRGFNIVNPVHAREWAAECPSLEHVALIRTAGVQLASGGEPASVRAARVSANLFTLFGVQPILGRTFLAEEEELGRDNVVILAETLWRARFNADPTLIDRSILIDGTPHQVIGIISASFRLPSDGSMRREIYRPLAFTAQELARRSGNYNYLAFARVKRGLTADQALAEINVVQARFPRQLAAQIPLEARLVPVHEVVTDGVHAGLWMLAAAVGAVLLIVCVNLANLLLSRMASRGREAAIRTALGASRARQFSQVLTESLVLSVSGGLLGMIVAAWILQLLIATTTLDIPRLDEARLDTRVLAFAFCITVLTGLLFGALPAWRFTRHHPQDALRAGSHTVTDARAGLRLREALISVEVGMSAALLIVAGLLIGSLTRLLHVDKGFDAARVLTLDVDLAGPRYAEPIARDQLFDRLLAKVRALPGVQSAAMVTHLPTLGQTWMDAIYLEGAPRDQRYPVNNRYASPDYFRVMAIAFRDGRPFDDHDRGRQVAVLSVKAAKLLWPDDPNPVGRQFMDEDNKLATLVGIVAEVRATLQNDAPPMAYYPYWQRPPEGGSVVIRTTAADASATANALRATLRSEDAQLAIPVVRTMEEMVDRSVAQRRFQMMLMALFAASALLVASLGIYGVVSYSVTRRRNEIGIRVALGAQRSRLLGLIVRQGMTPVLIGLAAGVLLALLLGQTIRGLLFGIQPTDPLTIAVVSLVLLVVGVLACLVPARRAASTDAIAALRVQ